MAYFDNAATTFPKPEEVYKQMDLLYRNIAGSVGRGEYQGAVSAANLLQDVRDMVLDVLHCPGKQVIFTPTATLALNMILQGLLRQELKSVYISPFEHNAVTRVLHHFEEKGQIKVHILPVDRVNFIFDFAKMKMDFERTKPDLVVISHVSNVTGLIAPIKDIFALAKQYNAYTVADMSQSAGLVNLQVGDIFDFAVFAGHKTLYGPTGISGFVMRPDIRLEPVLYGGTGYDSANQDMPDNLPQRFEMGTMNTSGLAGLHSALKWLKEQGTENIWQREQEHRKKLLEILQRYYFVKLIGISEEAEYAGIVSCLLDGISSDSAATIFNERNISVRTGLQCAPLAHKFLGTYPAGTIRFSVGYFTSERDFAELEAALDDIQDNI